MTLILPSRRALLGVGATGLCLATVGRAAAFAVPRSEDEARAAIRTRIQGEIDAGRFTGLSVALVRDGAVVWQEGFGWADHPGGTPVTPATAINIASTTKPITTTALMTRVAAGAINLDRPVNDWLGEAKIVDSNGPCEAATVRLVASHHGGLPTFFNMYEEGRGQPTVAELVRDYGHVAAPPGERYEYSNLGMAVIAEIVARSSGMSFDACLRQRVFDPLGMADSFESSEPGRRAQMAVRHDDDGAPLPFYTTATPGSGEVYASARDLARFAQFHLKALPAGVRPILNAAQLDELHRPITPVAPPEYGYGLGWQVLDRPGRERILYHGGGQSGVSTEFVLLPERKAAVVLLSNRRIDRKMLESLRDDLLRLAAPDWDGIPPSPMSSLIPLTDPDGYVGDWRGTIDAQGRPTPARLVIGADGKGTLAIGEAAAVAITDVGLLDGLLQGDTTGRIGAPDTERAGLDALSLNLKWRGEIIDGDIIAWTKTSRRMIILPFWTRLRRVRPD